MQKSKIEWTDYVWNPIKGLCPVGCWYCYARRIYKRFGMDPEIRQGFYKFPRKASRIFVCSTFELFHPLADPYRNNIFKHIEFHPQHTFIILTKMPQNIDRPMPENVWLGVSVEGVGVSEDRIRCLAVLDAKIKFVSFEPLLGDVACYWNALNDYIQQINWIIVGRLTGHGNKHNPTQANIARILVLAKEASVPVFMKNNLSSIWPGKLIQKWPRPRDGA